MISSNDQRILFYDDSLGTFTDYTKELNDQYTGSVPLVFDANDKLFFGTFLPFNSRYFNVSTASVDAAVLDIQVWDGVDWKDVNEVFDYTIDSGVAMSNSGLVDFIPDIDVPWQLVGRTRTNSNIPEFSSGPDIYNLYWSRIKFDNPTSFSLSYVGSLFSREDEFLAEYPHFTSTTILNSWKSGKTNWLDQRIIASEYIISDLKRRNIILDRGQIIERTQLIDACNHKTAQIIYTGLGAKNYVSEIATSSQRYIDAMNMNKFEVDRNSNAIADRNEKNISVRRFNRG